MPDSSPSLHIKLEPFRVQVHRERDSVRVAPVGELDIATVGALDAHLRDLHGNGFQRLLLDLRQLIVHGLE